LNPSSWQGNAAWAGRGTKSNACDAEVKWWTICILVLFFGWYQYL
jgi:hypothetical protein